MSGGPHREKSEGLRKKGPTCWEGRQEQLAVEPSLPSLVRQAASRSKREFERHAKFDTSIRSEHQKGASR